VGGVVNQLWKKQAFEVIKFAKAMTSFGSTRRDVLTGFQTEEEERWVVQGSFAGRGPSLRQGESGTAA